MSPKNNKIELFHSADVDLSSPCAPYLIIGGVHGDEPEGVKLATELLNWLKQQKKTTSWILIPCLNVDGYKANVRVNGNGVDLNRNYPTKNWSEHFEQSRYFPGSAPGSEPETKALVSLIQRVRPKVIIHCHSWKPMIVLTGPEDLKEALALSKCSGYKLEKSIGYPTPGSLSHFGWTENKIPVICIEEQEQIDPVTIWPRFKDGFASFLS